MLPRYRFLIANVCSCLETKHAAELLIRPELPSGFSNTLRCDKVHAITSTHGAIGAGYQIIKTEYTKLSGQVGVGFRRLQPGNSYPRRRWQYCGCATARQHKRCGLRCRIQPEAFLYSHTKVVAVLAIDSGKGNTMTTASAALQVKMTNVLSLSAGYQYARNSQPPMGVGVRPTR